MNMKANEQISMLMDGELSPAEVQHLITAMCHDPLLKEAWTNYHIIGAALKNSLPQRVDNTIANRVSTLLAQEPTVLAPKKSIDLRIRRFMPAFKQVAGLAVAASVTALAILSMNPAPSTPAVQIAQGQPDTTFIQPVNAFRQAALPTGGLASAAPVMVSAPDLSQQAQQSEQQWDLGDPAFEAKLNYYLNNHNEYSVSTDMQGILPYARIVDYSPNR